MKLTVRHEDGSVEVISTTDEHPFHAVHTGEWTRADALVIGDLLSTMTGAAELLAVEYGAEQVPVYNLSIPGSPTYYVGTHGVWVHNCSPNLGNKLEYIFGNATGSAHNVARSTGNAGMLSRIGIYGDERGRKLIQDHLHDAFANGANGVVQANGRVMKESLLAGPGGFLKVESWWEGNKLTTIFFKN